MLAGSAMVLLMSACGDGAKKRPLGSTCESDGQCDSGFCAEGQCLDPEGDADGDGIINRLEAQLGTNPLEADTDDDGVSDRDELNVDFTLKDSDGDGIPDVLESGIGDLDHDCIVDELDPRNTTSDGADDARVATLCPALGVCAAGGLAVGCPASVDSPVCVFDDVADHEDTEVACDGLDNDCDGSTDEGCASAGGEVGHWALDGDGADLGFYGDDGTVSGATAAPDRFGTANKALRFAKGGDRVDVVKTHHPLGAVTATYNIWVRPERGLAMRNLGVFSFGDVLVPNKRSGLVLVGNNACAEYVGEDNDAGSARACVPGGHWSMLSIVKSDTTVRFYLDAHLLEEQAVQAGQDLTSTKLSIGLSKVQDDGSFYEQFIGALDDLRVWSRALTSDELDALYREGGWQDEGTQANPAQQCLHIRDGGRPTGDGVYWLDADGDGPAAPFQAYCDMTTDGGGWTLVWVYGFTDFAHFDANTNAVTPIPSWPARNTSVPISTTPPTSPTTPGAVDFAVWRDLGADFAVLSDLNDGIACEPGGGSLADGLDGPVTCRTIEDVTPTCDGVVPTRLGFGDYGPSLSATNLYYYFDGQTGDNWPTHDPCGQNTTQQVAAPAREGGALYLRPSTRYVDLPYQCQWLPNQQRTNGQHWLDFDGPGGRGPYHADCRFVGGAGYTKVDQRVRSQVFAPNAGASRRVLFTQGDQLVVSPTFTGDWADDSFREVLGRWNIGTDAAPALAECLGSDAIGSGIGCSDGDTSILPDGPLAADGTFDLCLDSTCAPATLWTRELSCESDPGSLLSQGAFTFPDNDARNGCWSLYGQNGFMDGFALDMNEVPPGGTAPSLRADNPVVGNFIAAFNASQEELILAGDRSYTLSFWAKAASPRAMRVFIQPRDLSYAVYYEDVTVGTAWRHYDIGFFVGEGVWNALLSFQVAESSTAALWIDDVALRDDGPGTCSAPENLVGNGDFAANLTCWWTNNDYQHVLGSFVPEPTGGPDGTPAVRIEANHGGVEGYQVQLNHRGITLEPFYRYRLTFAAKASTPRTFFPSVARWDLPGSPTWLRDINHPLTTAWRSYTYDFVPTTPSPDGGATLYLDFGDLTGATVWVAQVQIEKLEYDPCAPELGLSNPLFLHGFACWRHEFDWDQVGVYPSVSETPEHALQVEVSQNQSQFDYQARIAQDGLQLSPGHGYELRFEAKADTARRGYTNIQEPQDGGLYLHLNNVVPYDTQWRSYELPFVVTRQTSVAGAKLEVGFGGAKATGITAFKNFSVTDFGPVSCGGGASLFGNVGFGMGRLCWSLLHDWDNDRAFATRDATTFGDAAPSLRIELASSGTNNSVTFRHDGLTLSTQQAYRLTFRAKASAARTVGLSFFDSVSFANIFYQEVTLTTDWQQLTVDVFPEVDAVSGSGSFNFLLGGQSGTVVWLDDVSLTQIVAR